MTAESNGILTKDRRKKIFRQLAESLTKQRPPPDEPTMRELAIVVDPKEDALTTDLRLNMIEYLKTIAAPSTPPEYRRRAFQYISSFTKLPREVLGGLIPELVAYAESEGDINLRSEIEESLLLLRSGNMSLERDLWEELYRYVRALMANPDPERQERGRHLNQRMRQITVEAKK